MLSADLVDCYLDVMGVPCVPLGVTNPGVAGLALAPVAAIADRPFIEPGLLKRRHQAFASAA